MARIAGVNIPTNKRVIIALTYIHGIGPHKAKQIADKIGIDHSRRVQDLSDQEVLHIRETIDAEHTVEGDLRRTTAMNIKRLMDLGCYRGLRHRRGLPVRLRRRLLAALGQPGALAYTPVGGNIVAPGAGSDVLQDFPEVRW